VAPAEALVPLLGAVRDGNYPPPAPGLILDWRRESGRWKAWVVWIDNTELKERICQAWLPVSVLRPARSDINVWNDGPWR
jgi:hypothetical protein